MKEQSSSASNMINRNWVLKRKRRKLPCGLDVSNGKGEGSGTLESRQSNSSGKINLKNEDVIHNQNSSKKKGNDGVSILSLSFFLF